MYVNLCPLVVHIFFFPHLPVCLVPLDHTQSPLVQGTEAVQHHFGRFTDGCCHSDTAGQHILAKSESMSRKTHTIYVRTYLICVCVYCVHVCIVCMCCVVCMYVLCTVHVHVCLVHGACDVPMCTEISLIHTSYIQLPHLLQ